MWIGVISDTCGELDPRVQSVFGGVDYILHCGSVGDPSILDILSHLAPVAGVIGANDNQTLFPFEKSLFRKWFEVGVYLAHDIGDPLELARGVRKEIEQYEPQVVLFGNTGTGFNSRIENRLFFNPGAAGPHPQSASRSVGLLEIGGRNVRAEIVPLDAA